MDKDFFSKMELVYIAFDELSFIRHGQKNDNEVKGSFIIETSVSEDEKLYKVTVKAKALKESEYDLLVTISGIFTFADDVTDDAKDELLNKNAVAILMPYVRSEIAILTAQPDTDSITLPIFDITKMMGDD